MDQVRNPYSPGSGSRPYVVAGRSTEIFDMDVTLQRVRLGRSARSQLLTGLRGVGKTVLLEEFARVAGSRGFIHEHIEIAEDGRLAARLAGALRKALFKLAGKKKVKGVDRRALGVLTSFSRTHSDGASLPVDGDEVSGIADSGDLASDFGGLFEEIGRAADAHGSGVFLTLDELQNLSPRTFGALVLGLQRSRTTGLPITLAGAGLPLLATLTGEARSYAERTFRFRPLGPLAPEDAAEALALAASAEGVTWKGGAIARLYELTQGYPYFIQEFAKQAWDVAEEGSTAIRLSDVERSLPLALAELDQSFFGGKAEKTTVPERAYLRAMAELGPGIVKSAEVAALLQKKTTQVAPVRDALLKKGLCFSPRFNELGFTVPLFDQFMRRWLPDFR